MNELLWWGGQLLWIVGAAIGLSVMSYERWAAIVPTEPRSVRRTRLKQGAVAMVCLGLWLASGTWQERVAWTVVGGLWWYLLRDFAP